MEGFRLVTGAGRQRRVSRAPEQLQGLGLGGGGKGIVADALVRLACLHGGVQQLFGADFVPVRGVAAKDAFQLAG
ncbi:hypothetical protein D3C73_1603140 [compost metagenome]